MPATRELYEEDFVRWAEAQATALRRAAAAGSNLPLDWLNLAEEVESLGLSQRRELRSRLSTLIEHLLKLQYSNAPDPRAGWIETVGRERREIELLLEDSPSLRRELGSLVALEWSRTAPFVCDLLVERREMDACDSPDSHAPGYAEDQLLGSWLPDPPR